MKNMKWKLLLVALAIVTYPWNVQAADPTQDHQLGWTLPTTYTNNDPILSGDLVSVKVKHGTVAGTYPDVVTIPSTTTYIEKNLLVGTHYFVVTVVTKNGLESANSNEINIPVTDDRVNVGCGNSLKSTRIR